VFRRKMSRYEHTEAEKIILQAIGHSKRRGIIRIIGATPEGVTYSGILEETKLNPDHLNFHLRRLEGFIEKSDDSLYHLMPLGVISLELLNSLNIDVTKDLIPYIEAARNSKGDMIHPFVKGLLYLGIVGVGAVFVASLFFVIVGIMRGVLIEIFVAGGFLVFSGVIIWVLINSLKTVPEFVRRLERKLVKD